MIDPRPRKATEKRIKDLEVEIAEAGFRGQVNRVTEMKKELDALYATIGKPSITPSKAVAETLRPNDAMLRARSRAVVKKIYRPRGNVE